MTFLALLLCLSLFCGCLVLLNALAKLKGVFSRTNKHQALERWATRWRAIGP